MRPRSRTSTTAWTGKIRHLLLDEFQDTSTTQWRVLRPIAKEIAAYGDRTHSLFCVGDVKQAIYGWRGGSPRIFQGLADDLNLPGRVDESLDRSYRSSPVVLDAVNRVFRTLADNPAVEPIRGHAADWARHYSEQVAVHQDQPGYVRLATAPAGALASDEDEQAPDDTFSSDEPDASPTAGGYDHHVARYVTNIAQQLPGLTIGVLVATNKQVRLLRLLLRSLGLHASGEGGASITDHPAVSAALAAITLADHPEHTAAAYLAVHSPLRAALGLPKDYRDHTTTVGSRIRRELVHNGYAATLTAWAGALAPACDRVGMNRLQQLVELADRYDRSRTLRPGDFVRYVEAAKVQETTPASTRVMTLHKAKGLEFDAVVLPYLHGKLADDRNGVVDVLSEGEPDRPPSVFCRADKLTLSITPDLHRAYQQTLARRAYDDFSKLYVAMTRARYGLYMLIPSLVSKNDGQPKAAGFTTPSHAAILRHALGPGVEAEGFKGDLVLYETGNPAWAESVGGRRTTPPPKDDDIEPARLDGVILTTDKPTRSWHVVTPSSAGADTQVDVDDLLRIDTPVHRTRGTVLHAWLAMIEWLDAADDVAATFTDERLIEEAARVAPGAESGLVKELMREFRRILRDMTLKQALRRPPSEHPNDRIEVWRERPFAVRRDNDLLKGIFDRVVIWRLEQRCVAARIIDFKTDRLDPDQPIEPANRYREQLNAYRAALSGMLCLDKTRITTGLLFIDPGGCRVVRV